jgi:hypothetical protein
MGLYFQYGCTAEAVNGWWYQVAVVQRAMEKRFASLSDLPHPTWSLAQLRQLAASKVPVRVSWWQFFDQQHLQQDRSDTRRFRATPWEVRPVLKIEVLKDQSWFDLDNTSLQSANNLAKPQQ